MAKRTADLLELVRSEGWTARVKAGYNTLSQTERAVLKDMMELPLFR